MGLLGTSTTWRSFRVIFSRCGASKAQSASDIFAQQAVADIGPRGRGVIHGNYADLKRHGRKSFLLWKRMPRDSHNPHPQNLARLLQKPMLISVRKRTGSAQIPPRCRIYPPYTDLLLFVYGQKRPYTARSDHGDGPPFGNACAKAAVSALEKIHHGLAGGTRAHGRHVVAAGHDCGGAVGKYGGKWAGRAGYEVLVAIDHQDGFEK